MRCSGQRLRWLFLLDVKFLALALICAYQKYISPWKGYCCSYRAHTGCSSCSALGYRAIRMKGIVRGMALLMERLYLCGVAHRRYGAKLARPPKSQRGDCDVGCVDLPGDCDGDCGGRGKSGVCEAARCLDSFGCDGPSKDRKGRKGKKEAQIHLPPKKSSARWR